MREFFDHTADAGVRLRADDFPGLAAESAEALLELMTGAPATVEAVSERTFSVDGVDAADVLVALGNELLFLFEVEGFLCSRLECTDRAGGLDCVARGEVRDPARHPISRPVKAVTHHGAEVRRDGAGWTATLVYDL